MEEKFPLYALGSVCIASGTFLLTQGFILAEIFGAVMTGFGAFILCLGWNE